MITAKIIGWEDGTDQTDTGWWYDLDGTHDILVGPLGPDANPDELVAAISQQVARTCKVDVNEVSVGHK